MLCSRMSLVRACCVRGQRETERQRQTELFFLFLCTQPKVPTKVGGVPKNKTREQQAQAARQKKNKKKERFYSSRRERERSIRRDFFKTFSTNQPKNEKAKQDEKYLDALSEARSILPLFLKDQQKANGRNPCVTTLYSLFRGRRTPPNNNNAHVLF